jgi:hypothetical protein
VAGYDREDCLGLLRAVVGDDLPPIVREVADADVDVDEALRNVEMVNAGNPVWRGVWCRQSNLHGPEPLA